MIRLRALESNKREFRSWVPPLTNYVMLSKFHNSLGIILNSQGFED